ncbi:MAG: hypothetical protein V1897_04070, partial [Pseudomonadota bacterium]
KPEKSSLGADILFHGFVGISGQSFDVTVDVPQVNPISGHNSLSSQEVARQKLFVHGGYN